MAGPSDDKDLATTLDTLDALIDTERKLFDAYVSRTSVADARAAGVLTAVLAVATVTVAVSRSVSLSDWLVGLAACGYFFLVLAVGISVFRAGAGLRRDPDEQRRRNFSRLLTVESQRTKDAVKQVRRFGLEPGSEGVAPGARDIDPIDARLWALELWRARAEDAHTIAIGHDRVAFPALISLVLGLTLLAVLGLLLIIGVGTG